MREQQEHEKVKVIVDGDPSPDGVINVLHKYDKAVVVDVESSPDTVINVLHVCDVAPL